MLLQPGKWDSWMQCPVRYVKQAENSATMIYSPPNTMHVLQAHHSIYCSNPSERKKTTRPAEASPQSFRFLNNSLPMSTFKTVSETQPQNNWILGSRITENEILYMLHKQELNQPKSLIKQTSMWKKIPTDNLQKQIQTKSLIKHKTVLTDNININKS